MNSSFDNSKTGSTSDDEAAMASFINNNDLQQYMNTELNLETYLRDLSVSGSQRAGTSTTVTSARQPSRQSNDRQQIEAVRISSSASITPLESQEHVTGVPQEDSNGNSGRQDSNGNSGRQDSNGNSGRQDSNGNSGRQDSNGNSGRQDSNGNSGRQDSNGNSGRQDSNGNSGRQDSNGNSGRQDSNWHNAPDAIGFSRSEPNFSRSFELEELRRRTSRLNSEDILTFIASLKSLVRSRGLQPSNELSVSASQGELNSRATSGTLSFQTPLSKKANSSQPSNSNSTLTAQNNATASVLADANSDVVDGDPTRLNNPYLSFAYESPPVQELGAASELSSDEAELPSGAFRISRSYYETFLRMLAEEPRQPRITAPHQVPDFIGYDDVDRLQSTPHNREQLRGFMKFVEIMQERIRPRITDVFSLSFEELVQQAAGYIGNLHSQLNQGQS